MAGDTDNIDYSAATSAVINTHVITFYCSLPYKPNPFVWPRYSMEQVFVCTPMNQQPPEPGVTGRVWKVVVTPHYWGLGDGGWMGRSQKSREAMSTNGLRGSEVFWTILYVLFTTVASQHDMSI